MRGIDVDYRSLKVAARGVGAAALCLVLSGVAAGATAREEGLAAFRDGRYSVAFEKLRTAAASDPQDATARTFLALTEAAREDCEAALPVLETTRGSADLERLASLAAVKCYSASSNDAKTFALLEKLQRQYPKDADVLYLTARLHMKAFNDATFAMFQQTPGSYRVHELSAQIFEVQNRYGDAVAEYRKAIDGNPGATDLHFRLGRALLLENHGPEALEQAAEAFRAELKVSPEDGACEFQLGQIAQVQGRRPEARTHFERALQLSPDFVQAAIALAKLETQDKHLTAAIALLQRAVKLQPANETAHYALMTAYRDAGDMARAKTEKQTLDRLQKPPEGEFSEFLKKLGETKPPE